MISMHTARVAPEKTEFSARPAAVLFAESFGESEMKLTYAQQLKHPNWQKKRLEMLDAAGWECGQCGTKDVTLHVHHKQYIKGRMAWEYGSEELAVLCEECHEEEHYITDEMKGLLAVIDSTETLALLRGFHFNSDWFDPWIGDAGRDRDPRTYAIGFAARLLTFLSLEQISQVMQQAVALTHETCEARPMLEKASYVFKKD
ncbi:MAG TPA: hypothetical protein VN081_06825 [Dongiaceae bacterium]|nr:hypothetical protein [Dongiaceae bacterium]